MGDTPPVSTAEAARIERFLGHLRQQGRNERTLRAYEFDWRHVAQWFYETQAEVFCLTKLDAAAVETYVDWSQEELGLKSSTVNRRLTFVKRYAAWAAAHGDIPTKQRQHIKRIPILKKPDPIPRYLNEDELRHFKATLLKRANVRDQAIVLVLLHTGLRVSELSQLTHDCIVDEFETGDVMIRVADEESGDERYIPLPQPIYNLMQTHWLEYPDATALFMGRTGQLTPERIAAIVKKYGEWARMDWITPLVLRHTFAYFFLLESNGDLIQLADVLGHSDLNSTRVYLKLLPETEVAQD
ncbi:MAG: tyrosine-type recombinase/integrase [Chloroflexi bacterium]|nr:tyrosine-type recombinase/integrase [Chloroflexota bacterium]